MNMEQYETRQKKLEELNAKKRTLELAVNVVDPKKFAEDFRDLAVEYATIDARANLAWCMNRYYHYSETPAPVDTPKEAAPVILEAVFEQKPFIPEPEFPPMEEVMEPLFDWQNRADIGDD